MFTNSQEINEINKKSPVTIEHILTEINLMSWLQFDTVQLLDLHMKHETILTNYICLKDLFLLK